jgi:heterodisulfide reductase subunit A
VTQASAAAARAGSLLNAGKVTVEAITCSIEAEACDNCGICADICPYGAITVDRKAKTPAQVVEAACAGCGTCGAACPHGAIAMRHFTDDQIGAQIDAILANAPREKVVVFACNWCSYAGGDTAGVGRMQYAPSGRLIRTMCSGRVSEEFVLRAFRKGAPIVLVSGCHFADCHYIDANRQTVKRVYRLWNKLERWGVRPERLQLEWISAAEGGKFQKTMNEMETLRAAVSDEEITQTMEILTAQEEKQRRKRRARAAKHGKTVGV